MKLLVLLTFLFFSACAETEVREGGQRVFRTQADVGHLELTTKGTHLVMDNVNHSNPTLAGGRAFTMGANSVGTTAVSGLLTGGLPWQAGVAAGAQAIPQLIAPAAPIVLQSKH